MSNKIIFINFWPKGGMRHYSDAIVNSLSKENEIIYISNYKSEIKSGGKVLKLSLNIFSIYNFIGLIYIISYLIEIKPKVVHLNSGYPILFPIYPIFYFFNSVITIHDAVSHEGESYIKKFVHKFQLIAFSLFFKKIIVHSDSIKNQLPWFINRKKVFIMPHVNYNHLSAGNIHDKVNKDNKFRVLFFGRILEYKGLKYLVESFDSLDESKYELIIAGEGVIGCKINKKNIKVFNRFINDSEIPIFFNEADVVAIPYLTASQSGVAYLALAYNKPVIATNVGSIGDVIFNENNGLIVESKSSKELALSIEYIGSKLVYDNMVNNIKTLKISSDLEINNNLIKVYCI